METVARICNSRWNRSDACSNNYFGILQNDSNGHVLEDGVDDMSEIPKICCVQ